MRRLIVALVVCAACSERTPVERSGAGSGPPSEVDPANVGEWSVVWDWPQEPGASNIGYGGHLHLLPTGDVLYWGDYDLANPPERLWTPSNPDDPTDPGTFALAADPGYNLFCSSHSFRRDGRLFVASGHPPGSAGSERAILYDPFSDTWTRVRNMNDGRWYGTTITLADGAVVSMSGANENWQENLLTQVYENGPLWRNLSTAVQSSAPTYFYPRIHLAPNNKVFLSGPYDFSRYLDTTGTGMWSDVDLSMVSLRLGGTSVMYDPGRVIILGGSGLPDSAERIDLNSAAPAWDFVPPMSVGRIWSNATILPDGKVLVTAGGVVETELWDPAANDWKDMAPAAVPRAYHSTAALLPDGRVLSMGGDNLPTAELYKPPYFFLGPRPVIVAAPSIIVFGRAFEIETPDAWRTKMVTLVRLTSVTHGFNMNQRFISLPFSLCGDTGMDVESVVPPTGCLTVQAPGAGVKAPPGHYMMFLVDGDGRPSHAAMLQLVEPALRRGLSVDPMAGVGSDGNGVFEPGETVTIAPVWANPTADATALTGSAGAFTGPPSGIYSIPDDAADYGAVPAGGRATCLDTGDCYALSIVPDPFAGRVRHWDATFEETTSAGPKVVWELHVGDSFTDVPRSHANYADVETALHNSVMTGCGAAQFCPATGLPRGQMTMMQLTAMHGIGYTPPLCTPGFEMFADVPASMKICPWVEELARRGVVEGCGGLLFCPFDTVTRGPMARYSLATLEGNGYAPPDCVAGAEMFTDVPASDPNCPWIEEIVRRGVVTGCTSTTYCPTAGVSRGEASRFLVGAFALPLYAAP